MSFAADSELHILDGGKNIACLGSGRSRIAGYEHKPYGAESRYRDDPEEESYDTAGLVVRVIAGGVVVCGATIATGGIAAAAGASAATGTAMMSAAAMTGGLAVTGMAATDYVSGRLSSYESYMKTALAGSVVGAMTGAAAYAPVSGGLAHGALDLGTGMAGDALMQLAMTDKVDGEQMFYSGMVSVLVGAVVRGGGIVEEGGSAAEGAVRKNNAPRIKGGKVNTVNSKPVTNTDNLDDLRYEQYWDDVKAGKYDIPYGMTEDEYYEFLKGMDKVDEGVKGGRETANSNKYRDWDGEIPRSGDEWEQYFKDVYGDEAVTRNTWDINEIKTKYAGDLIKVNKADTSADKLAKRIGGTSRVRFENDWDFREFDAISNDYIAQAKPALSSANPTVKNQMKATFEAAKATGKKVYYQFEGRPNQSVIDKLMEYSHRYGIDVIIDTNPLN